MLDGLDELDGCLEAMCSKVFAAWFPIGSPWVIFTLSIEG